MPPIILYEDDRWTRFLPLVYLRATFQLRCGVGELWQRVEQLILEEENTAAVSCWCRPELEELVVETTQRKVNTPVTEECLLLNGRAFWTRLPDIWVGEPSWVGTSGENDDITCIWASADLAKALSTDIMQDADALASAVEGLPRRDVSDCATLFDWPWDVVNFNATAVIADWRLSELHGTSYSLPGVHLLRPDAIHLGAGTRVKPCVVIDAEEGPVWIGANVTVQPHSYIQGPCYIGNDCLIQPRSVVREGCSFGPRCKIGGEFEASIIHGFSNKQHDGFLGHAYLGEWINIGADTLNSDLKNTYGTVRVPINGRDVETGQQFIGLLMGDHTKTGINVTFATGAVVGACSNVVISSPPKFVPSFTWLAVDGPKPFDVERCLDAARRMMARRSRELTPTLEAAIRSVERQAADVEHRDV